MNEIIDMIKTLIDKGYAYAVDNGDVYFRPAKFNEYGKLSHQPLEDLEAGARINIGERKENPMDFALWKGAKPGEPSWETPWGMVDQAGTLSVPQWQEDTLAKLLIFIAVVRT